MRRYLVVAVALAIGWPHAGFAKGKDKKDAAGDSDDDDDKSDDAPKAKPKGKDKDKDKDKDAKAKAKAKAKPSDDDDDSDDDKPSKDKDKDAKAKAKAKPPAKPADDDSDDDKDSSKFGGKKVTGADAVGTGSDDDSGGGGGDGSDSGSGGGSGEQPLQKQDLTGHDMGSTKKSNAFEQDRFFVDKRDDKKTAQGTLIQGSLTLTAFVYNESSADYPSTVTPSPLGSAASTITEAFTDLRLQTDFRHIAASRWDARIDARIRLAASATPSTITDVPAGTNTVTVANNAQSGLTGQNEYELRELWLVRNGDRSDLFFGRQFIADLAAVKIDGLRIDYASSQRFTLLGFAGLFPVRGSRSIDTDYIELKNDAGEPSGKVVTAEGFGAAYRTESAYGSFGGVAEIPIDGVQPRLFGTAQGYWRYGSTLDIYHFALIDVLSNAGLTNLSGGINYKPTPRLRITAGYNRVDTDTLNLQANAFLSTPGTTNPTTTAYPTLVQNQVFVSRLATNQLRGGISAGLGNLERFEISVSAAFRERQPFSLSAPDGTIIARLAPTEGVELYASITDRRSFADLRIGADVIDTFGVGSVAYERSEVTAARLFAGRDLASGKGEWEAEAVYSKSSDDTGSMMGAICTTTALADCYGLSNATVLSIGGTVYYRFNRDWFGIASAYLSETTLTSKQTTNGVVGTQTDPGITGLTGFIRVAYRF